MSQRQDVAPRPRGCPIMYQTWDKLVFLHWAFAPEVVRPLVPRALELDLFDGLAWIGIAAFRVTRMHPPWAPPVPGLSDTHQINVRTYVRRAGDLPGVWFFSLDATNWLAVLGARLAFHLPFYHARMEVEEHGTRTTFRAERKHPRAPETLFDAAWELGTPIAQPRPATLEFFLVERYVLFAANRGRISRGRIRHRPWTLREVHLEHLTSTMLAPLGLRPSEPPLVHAQGDVLGACVWRPRPLESA